MAARSVLVSIAVIVTCSFYGCSGDQGAEGQPARDARGAQWGQDKPWARGEGE